MDTISGELMGHVSTCTPEVHMFFSCTTLSSVYIIDILQVGKIKVRYDS